MHQIISSICHDDSFISTLGNGGAPGAPRRRSLLTRYRRQQALLTPQINQWLHRLNLLVTKQIEQLAHVDEVDKARVELLVRIHIPEGLEPMAMVNVCVAAHHLAIDTLDVALERLGETRRLAEPVAACELGQWGVAAAWAQGLGCGAAAGEGARGISCGGNGNGGGVSGEDIWVVDLADDPFLDEVDVLDCGDLDGFLLVVEPRVRVAAGRHGGADVRVTNGLARLVVDDFDDFDHLLEEPVLLDDWSHGQN
jgi:hypothetical protein